MRQLKFALLLPLFLFWPPIGKAEHDQSVVHVEAWTTFGERIDHFRVTLRASPFPSVPLKADYETDGKNGVAEITVPTGVYVMAVGASLAGATGSEQQIILAYSPKMFRTVALSMQPLEGYPRMPRLTGTVRNYSGDIKELRVRLVGLHGAELRESDLDVHGSFGFPVDEGTYFLFTIAERTGGARLLDFRPLPIRKGHKETVTIDLKVKRGRRLPRIYE